MSNPPLNTYQQELNTDQTALKELVSSVLQKAKKLGASSAEVSASKDKGFDVNVRMGNVDTVEFNRNKGIELTVYFGHAKGSAHSTDTRPESIKETLDAACHIAKVTAEDPYAGLADKQLMAEGYPDLDLCHPWDLSVEQAINLALQCEDLARTSDPRIINSEGATLSTHQGVYVYGNSHGFLGSYLFSRHSLSCVLIAKEKEKMQRDYDYTVARDAKKLWSLEKLAKSAAEKTVKKLGSRPIKTGQFPVIFQADIVHDLISPLIQAISGRNLYRRSSFLLDALHETLFPKGFYLEEDPLMKEGLGSAPFDGEGVKTLPHFIIDDGELVSYVLSSYSARKLGLQTTGNAGGVHNLKVRSGSLSLDEMMREMGTGLLITDTMGNGSNITTGDYSQGASGFWIEQGVIQFPVEEITIAGNLRDMYQHIRAVGNDIDARTNLISGSILVDGMMIAGN